MRYPSIDILRTFAIVVMVVVHFVENLSGHVPFISGVGAPLFSFLSGASYCLWTRAQRARGRSELEISKTSVRRGLFVVGVGFAFNILVWLPEDTFNWDVLTLIGAALLLLNFARRLPLPVLAVAAGLAVLVSPVLRAAADYDSYWVNSYYDGDLTLSDVLIGFLATGYFPFFPWVAYSLTGFIAASMLLVESREHAPPSPWPVAAVGLGLIGLSAAALAARPLISARAARAMLGGWTMFPPTVEYVLATLGMSLTLLAATHQWVDRRSRGGELRGALNVAKSFSQHSFSIYVLHHVVHLWPLWIYGVAAGHEPTYYWMRATPVGTALLLAACFLACCYVVLRWIGPDRGYGVEACMRWLCD